MKGMVPTPFCPQICIRRVQDLCGDFFVAKITLLFKLLCLNSQQYSQGSDGITGNTNVEMTARIELYYLFLEA